MTNISSYYSGNRYYYKETLQGSQNASNTSGNGSISGSSPSPVSGASGVRYIGTVENLTFDNVIDLFTTGDLTVDELKRWCKNRGITVTVVNDPSVQSASSVSSASSSSTSLVITVSFKYNNKQYTIRCNTAAATSQLDSKKVATYTASQLTQTYKFTQQIIDKYFDVSYTKDGKVERYGLKPNCGYSSVESLRNALFQQYKNDMILDNFLAGQNVRIIKDKQYESASYLTMNSKYVTLTTANFMTYADQIKLATGSAADKLRQDALNKLINQFTAGDLAYNQVSTILDAIGVTSRSNTTSNGNYELTFKYNNKQYQITCNTLAAKSGIHTDRVTTYTSQQLTSTYKLSQQMINQYFDAVATEKGVTTKNEVATTYKLKSGYSSVYNLLNKIETEKLSSIFKNGDDKSFEVNTLLNYSLINITTSDETKINIRYTSPTTALSDVRSHQLSKVMTAINNVLRSENPNVSEILNVLDKNLIKYTRQTQSNRVQFVFDNQTFTITFEQDKVAQCAKLLPAAIASDDPSEVVKVLDKTGFLDTKSESYQTLSSFGIDFDSQIKELVQNILSKSGNNSSDLKDALSTIQKKVDDFSGVAKSLVCNYLSTYGGFLNNWVNDISDVLRLTKSKGGDMSTVWTLNNFEELRSNLPKATLDYFNKTERNLDSGIFQYTNDIIDKVPEIINVVLLSYTNVKNLDKVPTSDGGTIFTFNLGNNSYEIRTSSPGTKYYKTFELENVSADIISQYLEPAVTVNGEATMYRVKKPLSTSSSVEEIKTCLNDFNPAWLSQGIITESEVEMIQQNAVEFLFQNDQFTEVVDASVLLKASVAAQADLIEVAKLLGLDPEDYLNQHLAETVDDILTYGYPQTVEVASARSALNSDNTPPDYIVKELKKRYGEDTKFSYIKVSQTNGTTVYEALGPDNYAYAQVKVYSDGRGKAEFNSSFDYTKYQKDDANYFNIRTTLYLDAENNITKTTYSCDVDAICNEFKRIVTNANDNERKEATECLLRTLSDLSGLGGDQDVFKILGKFAQLEGTARSAVDNSLELCRDQVKQIVQNALNKDNYKDLNALLSNSNGITPLLSVSLFASARTDSSNLTWAKNGGDGILGNKDSEQNESIGDCWYLSRLRACLKNDELRQQFQSMYKMDTASQTCSVTIGDRTYTYSFADILKANELSSQEIDVRVWEMAAREFFSSSEGSNPIATGGYGSYFLRFLGCTGVNTINVDNRNVINPIIGDKKPNEDLINFMKGINSKEIAGILTTLGYFTVEDQFGKKYKMGSNHDITIEYINLSDNNYPMCVHIYDQQAGVRFRLYGDDFLQLLYQESIECSGYRASDMLSAFKKGNNTPKSDNNNSNNSDSGVKSKGSSWNWANQMTDTINHLPEVIEGIYDINKQGNTPNYGSDIPGIVQPNSPVVDKYGNQWPSQTDYENCTNNGISYQDFWEQYNNYMNNPDNYEYGIVDGHSFVSYWGPGNMEWDNLYGDITNSSNNSQSIEWNIAQGTIDFSNFLNEQSSSTNFNIEGLASYWPLMTPEERQAYILNYANELLQSKYGDVDGSKVYVTLDSNGQLSYRVTSTSMEAGTAAIQDMLGKIAADSSKDLASLDGASYTGYDGFMTNEKVQKNLQMGEYVTSTGAFDIDKFLKDCKSAGLDTNNIDVNYINNTDENGNSVTKITIKNKDGEVLSYTTMINPSSNASTVDVTNEKTNTNVGNYINTVAGNSIADQLEMLTDYPHAKELADALRKGFIPESLWASMDDDERENLKWAFNNYLYMLDSNGKFPTDSDKMFNGYAVSCGGKELEEYAQSLVDKGFAKSIEEARNLVSDKLGFSGGMNTFDPETLFNDIIKFTGDDLLGSKGLEKITKNLVEQARYALKKGDRAKYDSLMKQVQENSNVLYRYSIVEDTAKKLYNTIGHCIVVDDGSGDLGVDVNYNRIYDYVMDKYNQDEANGYNWLQCAWRWSDRLTNVDHLRGLLNNSQGASLDDVLQAFGDIEQDNWVHEYSYLENNEIWILDPIEDTTGEYRVEYDATVSYIDNLYWEINWINDRMKQYCDSLTSWGTHNPKDCYPGYESAMARIAEIRAEIEQINNKVADLESQYYLAIYTYGIDSPEADSAKKKYMYWADYYKGSKNAKTIKVFEYVPKGGK